MSDFSMFYGKPLKSEFERKIVMKISYTDYSKLVPVGAEGYQKGQEQAVIYTDRVDTYKELTYDEDERLRNPNAYGCSGEGNRSCQHIELEGEQAERFMKACGLGKIYKKDDCVGLSILWNLPRKEYNETNMWVNMSGYTYSFDTEMNFKHVNFVISDNRPSKEAQQKAINLIDMLNDWRSCI